MAVVVLSLIVWSFPAGADKAQQLFDDAYDLAASGLYERAAKLYHEGLKLEPDNGDSHYFLAEIYLRIGRLQDSATHFQKATELLNDAEKIKKAKLKILGIEDKLRSQKAAENEQKRKEQDIKQTLQNLDKRARDSETKSAMRVEELARQKTQTAMITPKPHQQARATEGEITPDEAQALSAVIEGQQRAIETENLEAQLALLTPPTKDIERLIGGYELAKKNNFRNVKYNYKAHEKRTEELEKILTPLLTKPAGNPRQLNLQQTRLKEWHKRISQAYSTPYGKMHALAAIAMDPGDGSVWLELLRVCVGCLDAWLGCEPQITKKGMSDGGELKWLNKIIAMNAENPRPYENRGVFYAERRRHKKAAADFQKALDLGSRAKNIRRCIVVQKLRIEEKKELESGSGFEGPS